MKLVSKLNESVETSLYSGNTNRNYEMYLRPVPKFDDKGKELKKIERYYVFRLLYSEVGDRTYPFIIRDEHVFIKRDLSGNIKEIKRICCPNTPWAKSKIVEKVDRDYCPICKYSFEQNSNAWKNYKTLGQIDETSLKIARESQRQWAAYIPVLVVSDPLYKSNNGHFKILRLSGDNGKATLKRILELIHQAQHNNISIFNGDEGVNIAMLCEKVEKISTRKNGEPLIDKQTGEPKTYTTNCITDVMLTKKTHAYDIITVANLEKLAFDETYGVPATKEQLQMFLNEHYLVDGATAADLDDEEEFGSGESSTETSIAPQTDDSSSEDDFEAPVSKSVENGVADETEEDNKSDDESDEFEDETPHDAISRIMKGRIGSHSASDKIASLMADDVKPIKKSDTKMNSNPPMPKDVEEIRKDACDLNPDDLPF